MTDLCFNADVPSSLCRHLPKQLIDDALGTLDVCCFPFVHCRAQRMQWRPP